jgi:hypothetical protein
MLDRLYDQPRDRHQPVRVATVIVNAGIDREVFGGRARVTLRTCITEDGGAALDTLTERIPPDQRI